MQKLLTSPQQNDTFCKEICQKTRHNSFVKNSIYLAMSRITILYSTVRHFCTWLLSLWFPQGQGGWKQFKPSSTSLQVRWGSRFFHMEATVGFPSGSWFGFLLHQVNCYCQFCFENEFLQATLLTMRQIIFTRVTQFVFLR